MIVPKKDMKIGHYSKPNLYEPIHVLSSAKIRRNVHNVSNNFIIKKILLTSCVEKEYIIGFLHKDFATDYKRLTNHPYFVNTVILFDLIEYCDYNENSLLLLNNKNDLWHNIDPKKPYDVSVHKITFN